MRRTMCLLLACLLLAGCAARENAGEKPEIKMAVGAFGPAVTDEGYFELGRWNGRTHIFYTDFEAGVRDHLCARPGCTHMDENCWSVLEGNSLLAPLGEYLYAASNVAPREGDSRSKLLRLRPGYAERETLYEFPHGQELCGGIASDGEKLYFPVETWNEEQKQPHTRLAVFDPETREMTTALDMDGYVPYWTGCVGREILLIKTALAKDWQEPTMADIAENGYIRPVYSCELMGWNADTGKMRKVNRDPIVTQSYCGTTDALYWVEDGSHALKKLEYESGRITQIDRLEPEEGTYVNLGAACDEILLLEYGTNKGGVFRSEQLRLKDGKRVGAPPERYSAGGAVHIGEMPLAAYGNKYLTAYTTEFVLLPVTEEDGTERMKLKEVIRLAFIDKEDYFAGKETYRPLTDMMYG